ncbi:MAG: class I SAM-dependent methyltransferase [Desulfobacterales bacterium]
MDDQTVIKAYKRYARNYDRIFGKVFEPGRRAVIDKMEFSPGQRILEVGVGTGLSLPLYPDEVSVAGIDISPHMLWLAREHLSGEPGDRRCLSLMDAQQMSFEDNSFDMVALMYVVTVVPQPDVMMQEVRRVCKPGGDIFVVNHFSNDRLIPKALETALLPFRNLIGFRPRFSMEDFLQQNPLSVVDIRQVNFLGYWTMLHTRNSS